MALFSCRCVDLDGTTLTRDFNDIEVLDVLTMDSALAITPAGIKWPSSVKALLQIDGIRIPIGIRETREDFIARTGLEDLNDRYKFPYIHPNTGALCYTDITKREIRVLTHATADELTRFADEFHSTRTIPLSRPPVQTLLFTKTRGGSHLAVYYLTDTQDTVSALLNIAPAP